MSNTTQQPALIPGQAIPVPPDFPVHWDNPDDARLLWTMDRMHAPDPISALASDLSTDGFDRAATTYGMPIRYRSLHFNTYAYSTMAPPNIPPAEMRAMAQRGQEKMQAVIGRLDEYWEKELLPEVKQFLADWERFDLTGATMPQLLAHLDETIHWIPRLWEIHFLIAFPFLTAISLFDEFYHDLFEDSGPFDAYRLLQGLNNKTVETGREQWRLSRVALAMPSVRRVLEEKVTAEVIPALEQFAEGQAFRAQLRAYLDEYGQRGDKFDAITEPAWIEDPTPVIKNLKDYVAQPERDLPAEMEALAAEREQAIQQTRERLKGYPGPVVAQFEQMLKAAQTGTVLSEDHGFWIDYRSSYQVRRLFLEFGRRLAAAGVIDRADDVIHLLLAELKETAEALPRIDRHALVARRKAEMEHFRAIQPPPMLGTLPLGGPPDNIQTRSISKFFGAPPTPSTDPHSLAGHAGSPGTARGPAKVIRSLTEASKLKPGDILVAETTAPPWTPLFAIAAAVVTDTGGILSHCAVVAREYRIPAVVGTGRGTMMIKDEQMIEVDGNAGIVRIL